MRNTTELATGVAGIAALATAGGLAWSASALRHDAENGTGSQRAGLNDELERRNTWTVAALASGALLAATTAALFLWNRQMRK